MTGLFGTTPGPWWVFNDDSGDRPYPSPSIQAPESEDCAVVHWDGFRQDYWQSANGDIRQIEANARAIAQVPATLELVKRVCEMAERGGRYETGPLPDFVEDALEIARQLEKK